MHGATLRSDHECPIQAYSPENITIHTVSGGSPHCDVAPTAFANSPRRTPAKVEGD